MKNKSYKNNSLKNIKIAFLLNISFTIFELVGGYLTNSIAIISDALHDLGDSISLGVSYLLEMKSLKKDNKNYSYGLRRLSLLGAFLNIIVLVSGAVFIIKEAITRFFYPQRTLPEGMFFLALIGVIVNGYGAYRVSKGKNLNEKVISLHLLEDVLGWMAVLIVSVFMIFFKADFLDPTLSILISVFVLVNAVKNFKKILKIFLQGVPEGYEVERIKKVILEDRNILDVHDLHIWTLDGEKHILSAHIVLMGKTEKDGIEKVKSSLKDRLKKEGIEHSTLEIEFNDEVCKDSC